MTAATLASMDLVITLIALGLSLLVAVFFGVYFLTHTTVDQLERLLKERGYKKIGVKVPLYGSSGSPENNFRIIPYDVYRDISKMPPDMRRQIYLTLKGKPSRMSGVDSYKGYLQVDYTPRRLSDLPKIPDEVMRRM